MVTIEKIARLASGGKFDSAAPPSFGTGGTDLRKVKALGEATKHDTCASTASNRQVGGGDRIGEVLKAGVCHAFTPDGRCVSLFKTLFTNSCDHDCAYCPNSTQSSSSKIFSYTPEELAKITLSLYRGNYIEGLFLSSGITKNEDVIMEKMLESVRLLREKHRFMGYIHLKILPGASREHIKQAVELVDRVSINVESPSRSYMSELSQTKDYEVDILRRQRYVRDSMNEKNLHAGQTTQFIVGAGDETDQEIFRRMLYEYNVMDVKRSYFSAFCSVEGTALETAPSQPRWRENRLYQLDWLHRVYKFDTKEIRHAFNEFGNVGNRDPKYAIAVNLLDGPIDPNEADYRELIRIPGIGPRGARKIVGLRKMEKIRKREQLASLGIAVKRARIFLKLNGWRDTTLDRWSQ